MSPRVVSLAWSIVGRRTYSPSSEGRDALGHFMPLLVRSRKRSCATLGAARKSRFQKKLTKDRAQPAMTNKSGDAPITSELPRVIGVSGVAFTAFNCVVGVGIFGLPGLVAGVLGSAAIFAYAVCLVLIGLIALCLAEAGSRVSDAGGLYAYASSAFGPVVGGVAGALFLFASSIGSTAALARFFMDTLAGVWPTFSRPDLEFRGARVFVRRARTHQHPRHTRWQSAHHCHRHSEVRAACAAGHRRRLFHRSCESRLDRAASHRTGSATARSSFSLRS